MMLMKSKFIFISQTETQGLCLSKPHTILFDDCIKDNIFINRSLYDLNVLNFALFRYNSRVDSKSEIRFDSGLEPPRLLDEIGHIPYDGTGTSVCLRSQ